MQVTKNASVSQIVQRSYEAYLKFADLKIGERQALLDKIKQKLMSQVEMIAQETLNETGMGKYDDKVEKLKWVIEKTPGTEDLITDVSTNDDGLTLYELSAYGVVCAVHPCTNPCATLINNTLSILAAGNSVIHCPHPRAVKVSRFVVELIDSVIKQEFGIEGLVTIPETVSRDCTQEIMVHPDVSAVVVTGSDAIVNQAMVSNKKVIAAGPANPVVMVDETADILKAAKDITDSASFDNNLLCTSEKCIVAVDRIVDVLAMRLEDNGVFYTRDLDTMMALTVTLINQDLKPNKLFNGKDANYILEKAGIQTDREIRLIVCETPYQHPFVQNEMMMPVLPMIRVDDFKEALKIAVLVEQGYRHTSVLHSQMINRLNEAAKIMQTSIFVKNGPSYAGIGIRHAMETSFTVATRTGEGTITARHFARRRRCSLITGMSIR